MDWFLLALKKFGDFSGRSRRSEYWYFVLYYVLIGIALGFVDTLLGTTNDLLPIGLLETVFTLAMLIPSGSVSIRRLHDIGKSGWWLLLSMLPIVGTIILIVFFFQDSQPGMNEYGANPKES